MHKIKIAYFGTPYFSAQFLEKVLTGTPMNRMIEVKFVVTRPDQPVGRKQITTPSPVKLIAKKYGIEVFEFSNLKIESRILREKIKSLDFAFLYAYGGIVPNSLLHQPRLGFLNTHPSLLPKYRGPSPIAYPFISGDTQTGVTLIQLDEKIDHGPIIMQEEITISPFDRRPDLEIKLTNLAFQMFLKLANSLTREPNNNLIFSQQDHTKATFTKMLEKKDGFVAIEDFKFQILNSPERLFNLFRGLYPWPGIWTLVKIKGQEKRLKITDVEYKDRLLILKKVQLEGKNEVDFETFNKAYRVF